MFGLEKTRRVLLSESGGFGGVLFYEKDKSYMSSNIITVK